MLYQNINVYQWVADTYNPDTLSSGNTPNINQVKSAFNAPMTQSQVEKELWTLSAWFLVGNAGAQQEYYRSMSKLIKYHSIEAPFEYFSNSFYRSGNNDEQAYFAKSLERDNWLMSEARRLFSGNIDWNVVYKRQIKKDLKQVALSNVGEFYNKHIVDMFNRVGGEFIFTFSSFYNSSSSLFPAFIHVFVLRVWHNIVKK